MSASHHSPFALAPLFLLAWGAQAAAPQAGELTEQQAGAALGAFVASHRTYEAPASCLRPRTVEYRNAGYTIDLVAAGCPGIAEGTALGRWRVDARSGAVFVRNARGKYVVPTDARPPQPPQTAQAPETPPAAPTPTPTPVASAFVREERTVMVGGVAERWRLEWVGETSPVCPPEAGWEEWGTCPCAGFEFAEAGDLDLVRVRPGAPEERLRLAPFFADGMAPGGKAVLKRWPLEPGDEDAAQDEAQAAGFGERVRQRALAPAMVLADYDHDGQASEFALQVGAIPCGHRQTIVVGVDPGNPRLHAFASVEAPGTPLVLEAPEQWERLRAGSGETTLVLWACGDHGSEEESKIRLRTGKDGIRAKVSAKQCP